MLYEEPFVFVGNADALRPEDGPITLAEALRQPLVVPAPRRRALLEDKARELGEQVHVRFEVESGSIMSDLIAQKLGYSILPASVVSSRVQRGNWRSGRSSSRTGPVRCGWSGRWAAICPARRRPSSSS